MKLTPDQQQILSDHDTDRPDTPLSPRTLGESALALAAAGWYVFPLRPRGKEPLLPKAHPKGDPQAGRCHGECGRDGHGAWDGTRDEDTIRRWWARNPTANIGANLGEDLVAFDLDLNHGGKFELGTWPPTLMHLTGRGNGNAHLIYRANPGTLAATIRSGTDVLGPGMDIRAGRGSYLVMPPSIHPDTARPYTVDPGGETEPTVLDDQTVTQVWAKAGLEFTAKAKGQAKGITVLDGGKPTVTRPLKAYGEATRLADLLADPPAEGGRNDWLTRVAGHYAKQYRDKPDLYEVHVNQANQMLAQPLDPAEVTKTADSIWRTENESHPERGASLNNGYLVGNGRSLMCQVTRREGEDTVYDLAPWGDFDLIARGVAVDDTGQRMFWVRLMWNGQTVDTTLDGATIADRKQLAVWLARYGASFDEPFNSFPKTAPQVRLLRYLNSQDPQQVQVADVLGYHEAAGGFVTHEGVITEDGPVAKELAGVVADPRLLERKVAPYHYGFDAEPDEAREVLAQVLTFQDETTAALFGAWWAACLLRPQFAAKTSLFPFFGVQAPSESGKTNGFFALMIQLNGNTQGQAVPTRPVLRDLASSNQSGIVWADDLDSLEPYGELLRASTSMGTSAKMDADRSSVKATRIVAPILLTGEALGMGGQKALADRSVVVNAPSPKGRMSVIDPTRPQWDDVLDLQGRYPRERGGLAVLAGHYVQMALERADLALERLKEERRRGAGRTWDKFAVLLAGAGLLDALVTGEQVRVGEEGDGVYASRVRQWVKDQSRVGQGLDQDNALTLSVLPWALRTWDFPEHPQPAADGGRFAGLGTPAYVQTSGTGFEEQTTVWVNTAILADAWARDRNNRVHERTESRDALAEQLSALGGGPSKTVAIRGTRTRLRYRPIPQNYSEKVIERAKG